MKVHQLNIQPDYLEAIVSGDKTSEVVKNDKGFQVGDRLVLRDTQSQRYVCVLIKSITDSAQHLGRVVLTFVWISGGVLASH